VLAIADRDQPALCPIDMVKMDRLVSVPIVMHVALPDGTRRFDGIRRAREAQREADEKRRAKTRKLIKEAS
jgi:hypothetical protein